MVIVTIDSPVDGRYWETFDTEDAGEQWANSLIALGVDRSEWVQVHIVEESKKFPPSMQKLN